MLGDDDGVVALRLDGEIQELRDSVVGDGAHAALELMGHFLDGLDVGGRTLADVEGGHAQDGGRLQKLCLDAVEVFEGVEAGDRLDTAQVGADAALGDDLHQADFAGCGNMRAAAQLLAEALHVDNADELAVLFAEQAGNSRFARGDQAGLIGVHAMVFHDLAVGQALHLGELLAGGSLEMGEVEAKAVGGNQAACLLDMVAQHLAQGPMQDVGGTVVSADAFAAQGVDGGADLGTLGDLAFFDAHVMDDQALFGFLGIGDGCAHIGCVDDAGVSHLAALLGIEGGLLQHDAALLARLQAVDARAILHQCEHLAIRLVLGVSAEIGFTDLLEDGGHGTVIGGPSGFGVALGRGTRTLALLLHAFCELLGVDLDALLGADFLGYLQGEAVGVVQGEGHLAGKNLAGKLSQGFRQECTALGQGRTEALFLVFDDTADEVAVFHGLGIDLAHNLDDLVDVVAHERAFDAQQLALHDGTAEQSSQDVAAAFVGGQDAVGDHEGHRTGVVRHDAQCHVVGFAFTVLAAAQTLAHLDEAMQHIGIEVALYALHDRGDALQAHAGVDVLLGQGRQGAVFLAVILGEHAVPVLQEAVAVATGGAIGAAATHMLALVEVQLGAGTAGAGGAGAPEVVVFAQTGDVAFVHTQALPDLDGLVIVLEDGEVEPIHGKFQLVHGEVERPLAHLLLEILAEAEVAQHLEEAQMAAVGADDVDVVGADALLDGRGTDIGGFQMLLLEEVGLELDHARTGEQQAGIVGNQRRGGHALTALFFEVAKVLLADFRGAHVSHRHSFLSISIFVRGWRASRFTYPLVSFGQPSDPQPDSSRALPDPAPSSCTSWGSDGFERADTETLYRSRARQSDDDCDFAYAAGCGDVAL